MKKYKNSIRFTDKSRQDTSMEVMLDNKDLVVITDNENESTMYRLDAKEAMALGTFLVEKYIATMKVM